jgi:hypothetical protein
MMMMMIMIMIMIMSMGWDYVSELRPPTCLLFIPHVIHEHWEPWWNYIDRGNFWFVLQWPLLVLRGESSSSKAKGTGEGNDEFLLTKYLFYTSQDSLTCRKMLRHVADGFTFALKKGVLREFYRSLKLSSSVGFKPTNLGSNDNDTNHYTTENDTLEVYRCCAF